MANLTGLTELNFTGIMQGGYKEPLFQLQGVTELVRLDEILEWLDDNSGGGGGITVGGEYDDDVAAGVGGIALNSYYTLSLTNLWGLPQGLVKKRLI